MALPGRADAPEPIQVTPNDDILPKLPIKQIVLRNFGRPPRSVRSTSAVTQATSAIKPGSIGVDGRFLGDTGAVLGGSGVLDSGGLLEVLNGGGMDLRPARSLYSPYSRSMSAHVDRGTVRSTKTRTGAWSYEDFRRVRERRIAWHARPCWRTGRHSCPQ